MINSPLKTYLELQREDEMKGGEWRANLERIVAKDYAVFARFKDNNKHIDMRSGNLYDYFFAGIRGLGTWGAAYFLDRRSKILLNYDPSTDIQILLEVTYWDGRILEITDVSDKPSSYFRVQNQKNTIKNIINDITHS